MPSPANLKLGSLLLLPADLPGVGAFWDVYERLDRGEVLHARRLGLLPSVDGETALELIRRAGERFAAPAEE